MNLKLQKSDARTLTITYLWNHLCRPCRSSSDSTTRDCAQVYVECQGGCLTELAEAVDLMEVVDLPLSGLVEPAEMPLINLITISPTHMAESPVHFIRFKAPSLSCTAPTWPCTGSLTSVQPNGSGPGRPHNLKRPHCPWPGSSYQSGPRRSLPASPWTHQNQVLLNCRGKLFSAKSLPNRASHKGL